MSLDSLRSALQPIADALAADGYILECSRSMELTVLDVTATPAACEDCLVPKDMMLRMIVRRLDDAGVISSNYALTLRYPNDGTGKGEV